MNKYFWIILCCCFVSIQLVAPILKLPMLKAQTFGLPLAAIIVISAAILYACSLLLHYLFHLSSLTTKVDNKLNKEI